MFKFTIEKEDKKSRARAGVIETDHGLLETPAFIPVGTKATVKSLTPEQVRDLGAQAVLANTYHLYLQPGSETVARAGGLHNFMNWSGPIFTDSGGFQAFSLGVALGKGINKLTGKESLDQRNGNEEEIENLRAKIDDEGVTFKSPIDGSTHHFTPERSIDIQHELGADIIFAFDECTAPTADKDYQKIAMARTHTWAKRCLDHHEKAGRPAALFGIVQGGRHQDLREESARTIGAMDFSGFGIGGSFDKDDLGGAVGWVTAILPKEKPRHLLGIGLVEDMLIGIEQGIDTFDCVAPTREARNGRLETATGPINITNSKYREDFTAIEDGCSCYTCKNYTKAYLAHLFRAQEMLAATLASIHNLHFVVNLARQARQAILDDRFSDFKKEFLMRRQKN